MKCGMLKGTCERASSSMEMETPDRTKAASSSAPISKFEDSPVFNYINNLSPIKPVKSIHIAQTLGSLSFASLHTIFTSPQSSSLKESRFHRRYQNLDLSKLKSPSRDFERENPNGRAEAVIPENFGARISIASTTVEQLSEHNEFAFELPHTLDYGSGSPDSSTNQDMSHQRVQNFDQQAEPDLGNRQTDPGREWPNLVPDTADLLIFSSPNDGEAFQGIIQRSPGLETGLDASISSSLLQNNVAGLQKMQLLSQVASGCNPEMGDASEGIEIKHTEEDLRRQDLETMGSFPCGGLNNEAELYDPFAEIKTLSNFQLGLRRRCLDFEMVGAHYHKSLPDSSNASSLSHPEGMIASTNLMLTSVNNKRGGESSMCILPGIGLHLNSLASTKNYYNATTHDGSFSETRSAMSCKELLPQSVIPNASDKEADESGNGFLEDNLLALVLPEEPNPNSPRKKRRKTEHAGEDDGCKRCNFPPIFLLKDHDESMKTPASARHKRGCNCKKSSCLKKYCECYQAGVGCSINCQCEGCKNKFGTKDGSVPVAAADCEAEDEEAEKCAKTGLHSTTPSRLSRSLSQMAVPLPPKSKPPRSAFLTTVGGTYALNATQKQGKAEFLLPLSPKFEKPPLFNAEDEMPEILRGSTTPNADIKTASPNRKRVSPPHGELDSSPSLRSSRRLILQSIPSFPSLTPQH